MRPSTCGHILFYGQCLKNQSTVKIDANIKKTNSLYTTNIKTQYPTYE
jgi:hypothetical protein